MSTANTVPKVKLDKLVNKLVDKWSNEYVDRAKNGDFESMLKVAEIQFSKKGWGKIGHNPYQGRRWVEQAASRGDEHALFTLKNLVIGDEIRKDKIMQMLRFSVNHGDHPRSLTTLDKHFNFILKGINPVSLMDQTLPQSDKVSKMPTDKRLRDVERDTHKGRYSPAGKLRNGTGYARYRFPHVLSRDSVHYTVKSILDNRIQHRVTDLVPRPIYEYIQASSMPSTSRLSPTDLASAIFNTTTLDTVNDNSASFIDKEYVHDGAGSVISGLQTQILLDRMDGLDLDHLTYDIQAVESASGVLEDLGKMYGNTIVPQQKRVFMEQQLEEARKLQDKDSQALIGGYTRDELQQLDRRGFNAALFLGKEDTSFKGYEDEAGHILNKMRIYLDDSQLDYTEEYNKFITMLQSAEHKGPITNTDILAYVQTLFLPNNYDLLGKQAPDDDGALYSEFDASDDEGCDNYMDEVQDGTFSPHFEDHKSNFNTIVVDDTRYTTEGRFPYRLEATKNRYATDPQKVYGPLSHINYSNEWDMNIPEGGYNISNPATLHLNENYVKEMKASKRQTVGPYDELLFDHYARAKLGQEVITDFSDVLINYVYAVSKNDPNVIVMKSDDIQALRGNIAQNAFAEIVYNLSEEDLSTLTPEEQAYLIKYDAEFHRDVDPAAPSLAERLKVVKQEGQEHVEETAVAENYGNLAEKITNFNMKQLHEIKQVGDHQSAEYHAAQKAHFGDLVPDSEKPYKTQILDRVVENPLQFASKRALYPYMSDGIYHYRDIDSNIFNVLPPASQFKASGTPEKWNDVHAKLKTNILHPANYLLDITDGQEVFGDKAPYKFAQKSVPNKNFPEIYPEAFIRSPEFSPEYARFLLDKIRLVAPSRVNAAIAKCDEYYAKESKNKDILANKESTEMPVVHPSLTILSQHMYGSEEPLDTTPLFGIHNTSPLDGSAIINSQPSLITDTKRNVYGVSDAKKFESLMNTGKNIIDKRADATKEELAQEEKLVEFFKKSSPPVTLQSTMSGIHHELDHEVSRRGVYKTGSVEEVKALLEQDLTSSGFSMTLDEAEEQFGTIKK